MASGIADRKLDLLLPLFWLKSIALALLLLKLAMLLTSGAFMDETYYWMWGQHPALSYFDHPPLNAWLLWLSSLAFGWNHFALRLPVMLTLFADIFVLWLFARRLMPQQAEQYFWVTLVLFLATPIFHLMSAAALPDHILMLTLLAALYGFCGFLQKQDRGEAGLADLYVGALFLGLAGLSKYNAAFLGLGLVLYIALTPRYRQLLSAPHLYLAAALTLALQAPVLWWNISERFASYDFIFSGRHAGLAASLDGIIPYLLVIPLLLSPFLCVVIMRFLFTPIPLPGAGLARLVFSLSTLALLVVSAFATTLFHWNLVAYCAMLPFLAVAVRWRWLLLAQVLYGTVAIIASTINYAVMPLADIDRFRDEASAWSYGWTETAAAAKALAAENKVGFIAAPDYTTASLLGFALKDRDVTSLSPRTDQFDFWFAPGAHAGQDALIFEDNWRPLSADLKARFNSLRLLQDIEVTRFGKLLDHHRLYLGKGFKPNG